jgi:GlpG protein
MYLIGELRDERVAKGLFRALGEQNIKARLEFDEAVTLYRLWAEHEADLARARELFAVGLGLPRAVAPDPEWEKIAKIPLGQVSSVLILLSIGAFACLYFSKEATMRALSFSIDGKSIVESFMAGEFWRPISPIFLHFGLLHLFFNMMWMKSLGSLIEHSFGGRRFLIFVMVSALLSNSLQFWVAGPMFGGMSGVVYGLLGLLWTMKKYFPDYEYALPKADAFLMILWFFLGLFGLIGNMANMAHAGGLCVGLVTAAVMGLIKNPKRNLFRALGFSLFGGLVVVFAAWSKF